MNNDPNRMEALLEAIQASKKQQQQEAIRRHRRNWWIKIFPIWGGVNL